MRIRDLLEDENPQSDLKTIQGNVYGQESGSGKADTSKPNYAGAIGPMQIMPGTFSWMQKSGMIPKDYEIANPEHNKAAGDALISHYHQKYQGDPAKIYAAYYAGPGAVNKDGSINTHWKDLKNPKAPTVGQYIQQAMARSGGDSSSVVTALQNAPSNVKDYISTAYGNVKDFVSSLTDKGDPNLDPDELKRQEELRKKRKALAAAKQDIGKQA